MNDHVSVREAAPADVPAANAFMLHILETEYSTGYRPEWHGDIDDLQGSYLNNPRQHLFVAQDASGAIVGTAVIRHRAPETWLPGRYDPETTCELGRVYVARSHRRQGLAHRLVESARRWAQEAGYRVISLHTESTNGPAIALWDLLGVRLPQSAHPDLTDTVFFELPIDQPVTTSTGLTS